jgi:manganese-dependent inorganic pyrophosphatase
MLQKSSDKSGSTSKNTHRQAVAMDPVTNPVYVVGHKHPDTDSVCSAIAYAYLKHHLTGEAYEPRRAGELNEETRFVLRKWKVDEPALLEDVRTQVRDIEYRRTPGVSEDLSLRKAWARMEEEDAVTLCVTRGKSLYGLITARDIVRSYMDINDAAFISSARTSYASIRDTIDAEMAAGSCEGAVTEGKVTIAAASPEIMEQFISKGDIVLLGNRYESQLCAIELGAQLIIICGGVKPASTIIKLADESGCRIMCTPHDTFTVARLINQSAPIRHFLRKENLITFRPDDFIDDIQDIMAQKRFRYFPIVDDDGTYLGMISRRNFLGAARKKLILVDHNERAQAVDGIERADVLEIIDHHRLASVETLEPVFFRGQPVGCTSTILYEMYKETGTRITKTIAGLLLSAILSDTLMFRSPTCTEQDRAAGAALARIAGVDPEEYAVDMFRAGSDLQNKTPAEILTQDFKPFQVGETSFGIGQVSSMSAEDLEDVAARLVPALDDFILQERLNMVFFLLTDILTESSIVLCAGEGSERTLQEAFNLDSACAKAKLPGVVSRKKQFLPAIMQALQA